MIKLLSIVLCNIIMSSASFGSPIDIILKKIERTTGCEMLVTSGYRSPKHNKAVGGAPNSFHLYDRARDIQPKDSRCISIKELGRVSCKVTSTIVYLRHIHIDNRTNKLCIRGRYK